MAHLRKQGFAHTTIKVYLAAIRNLHVASGNYQAFYSQLTPHLQQVAIKGYQERASQPPTNSTTPYHSLYHEAD